MEDGDVVVVRRCIHLQGRSAIEVHDVPVALKQRGPARGDHGVVVLVPKFHHHPVHDRIVPRDREHCRVDRFIASTHEAPAKRGVGLLQRHQPAGPQAIVHGPVACVVRPLQEGAHVQLQLHGVGLVEALRQDVGPVVQGLHGRFAHGPGERDPTCRAGATGRGDHRGGEGLSAERAGQQAQQGQGEERTEVHGGSVHRVKVGRRAPTEQGRVRISLDPMREWKG